MATIGTFTSTEAGFTWTVRTLALNAKVRIIANDQKKSAGAPDFRVLVGTTEIGAAWRKASEDHGSYLSIRLDDPSFAEPIRAALMEKSDGGSLAKLGRR